MRRELTEDLPAGPVRQGCVGVAPENWEYLPAGQGKQPAGRPAGRITCRTGPAGIEQGGGGGDQGILNLNAADGGGGAGVTNTGVCLGKDYFRPTNFRESLFLMHECLNRDHHRCDKPLKAKVFFILYPSRAV